MRLRWLLYTLVLAAILAGLEEWAVADHLYWKYVWSDTLMHFLGGLTIGTFAVALLPRFRPLWFAGFAAAAFLGWEVFEATAGVPHKANFLFDTSLDLLMDTLGAIAIYAVARKTLWRSN